ncbi:gluconate 2-dehydrogenase subunit 3 family protein [Daejeonella sp.]|uniref:gluconate 2-dehydrogenase subunit 3 family protein n=1 Tax=Daejeonella sp. TaxID=2805397 RepID=UPI00398378FA
MDRREAISRVTLLLGGALTTSGLGAFADVLHTEGSGSIPLQSLAASEALIAEIANTFIPDNKGVPGAKAAGLGPFIVMMMQDCYTPDIQKHFREGLSKVEEVSKSRFQKSFTQLSLKQREEIFGVFKAEAETPRKTEIAPSHFFQLMADLTYLGYYTSEIGATKALRYVHIPGKYEACVPLAPGQKAWAT